MASGYILTQQGSQVQALLNDLEAFLLDDTGTLAQLCLTPLVIDEQSGGTVLDFSTNQWQDLTVTADLNLETLNREPGCSIVLRIYNDASDPVAITTPDEWGWVSDKPLVLPVDKYALLVLRCHGVLESDISASFSIRSIEHLSSLKTTFDWDADYLKIFNSVTGNFEYATLFQLCKELFRVNSSGNLVIGGTRLSTDQDDSVFTFIGGASKTNAAYLQVSGDSRALLPGTIEARIKGTGTFFVSQSAFGNLSGTTVFEVAPDGDVEAQGTITAKNFKIVPTALDEQSGAIELDLAGVGVRTLELTTDAIFTTLNRAAGNAVSIEIYNSASDPVSFTFPAWEFFPAAPTELAAGKRALLALTCFGPDDTDMRASYIAQT